MAGEGNYYLGEQKRMNIQGIKKLLSQGEGLTVEFKAAKDTDKNPLWR
jgi:hypothetical protein